MRYSPSPTIKQIADLKGKLISIGGINDITFIYIKPFLASAGLKTSDVDFVYRQGGRRPLLRARRRWRRRHDAQPSDLFQGGRAWVLPISATPKPMRRISRSRSGPPTCPGPRRTASALTAFARNYRRGVRWLYDPANKEQAIDILVKYAKQDRKDVEDAYDYLVAKLKLFGLDGDVSDKTYEKMAEGLVEIGFIKKPFPPKSAIFDGSFVQQAAN